MGRLPMTNYIVPFGFDGENFAWVEFIGPGERNICIANVINNINNVNNNLNNNNLVETYKKNIDNKKFGHISHLKILNESKIFLVHSLNICEIRQLNQDFTLIESFKHLGDEVYAVDVYYPNEYLKMKNDDKMSSDILLYSSNLMKITKHDNNYKKTFIDKNLNNNKEEISKNEENQYLEKSKTVVIKKKRKKMIETGSFSNNKISEFNNEKIKVNVSNNSEYSNSNNIKKINIESINKEKNKEQEKESSTDVSYSIITLDIDGNVNLYQYGEEVTLFNLYNLKDISEKNKKDKFFSMGYEYYIKSNLEYFCISTDQGCFVVKKSL
jgi:hypothetical protein